MRNSWNNLTQALIHYLQESTKQLQMYGEKKLEKLHLSALMAELVQEQKQVNFQFQLKITMNNLFLHSKIFTEN